MSSADPIAQITQWLAEAERKEQLEPAAMSVATGGADGRPALRMVLLRGIDARGRVCDTNPTSRKAGDMRASGAGAWRAAGESWPSTMPVGR